MDWMTLIMRGLRLTRSQGAFQSAHRGIKLQQLWKLGTVELLGASSAKTKILHTKKREHLIKLSFLHLVIFIFGFCFWPIVSDFFTSFYPETLGDGDFQNAFPV